MFDLPGLCRELVQRGWWVTAAEKTNDGVIVGFNFMPHVPLCWLKAFEVPFEEATPDGIERHIEAWRERVLGTLEKGEVSATVRHLIAEHGREKVTEAMRARVFV